LLELPDSIRFFLDESLTPGVADALLLVGYPITSADQQCKRGVKDPLLIPWLAAEDYVWITKDDEARREHLGDIIKAKISTVWIMGIDRKKNKISPLEVHLMLTTKLRRIAIAVDRARGPVHFEIYLKGEDTPVLSPLDLVTLKRKQTSKQRRLGRRRRPH